MKIRLADQQRTQTSTDAPTIPEPPAAAPAEAEASEHVLPDAEQEHVPREEENAAPAAGADALQELAAEIEQLRERPDTEHSMMVLMDVLQTCGVPINAACAFASSLVRDDGKHQRLLQQMLERRSCVHALTGHPPTCVDAYGRENIAYRSNRLRPNLIVAGLDAFDLRTLKPCGSGAPARWLSC